MSVSTIRAIIAIAVGATVLRVIGLSWGLPASLHADEWAVVESAVTLTARGSFEPTIFLRPDHLEIKLSVLLYSLYSLFPGVGPIDAEYAADPTPFFLLSRSVTVLFGTAAVVLAGLIGAHFSRTSAIIAAAVFAVYPPFTEHARFATPDVPLLALSLLVVLACMDYLTNPRRLPLIVASIAVGASITVKYPGALGGVVIAASVIAIAARRREVRRVVVDGVLALGTTVATVFVISPVLLVNLRGVIAALRAESRTEHVGADGLGFIGNLAFYASHLAQWMGALMVIAAVVGAVMLIRRREILALPLIVGAVYWCALSALALHWDRWAIPMAITPLLLAAIAFGRLIESPPGPRPVVAKVATLTALGLSLAHMTVASVALTADAVVPDTRVSSNEILDDAGIVPENTAFEGYSPFATDVPSRVFDQVIEVRGELYRANPETEFLMISSCDNERFMDDARYGQEQEFYARIERDLETVLDLPAPAPLSPHAIEVIGIFTSIDHLRQLGENGRSGCSITVYSLPSAP